MSRTRAAWVRFEQAKRDAWAGHCTDLGLWDEANHCRDLLIGALTATSQDPPEDETMQEEILRLSRSVKP